MISDLTDEQLARVRQWLEGPDIGRSSVVLIRRLAFDQHLPAHHPTDTADFARCVRALSNLPFLRSRLPLAADLSEHWANLVTHWDTIERCFTKEHAAGAPFTQTYRRTRQAILTLLQAADRHETLTTLTIPDIADAPTMPRARRKRTAFFVLDKREVSMLINGRSIGAGVMMMKALNEDYATPCTRCGRKRTVLLDSIYPPSPDKRKCHECATLPATESPSS